MCLFSTSAWFLLETDLCLADGVGFIGPWGCQPLRSKFVGPQTRNTPRITTPESTDPGNQQNNTSQQPSPSSWNCPFCSRTFNKKTGLGVHQRRAHPAEFDEQRQRIDVKARWTDEETKMLARKEAELEEQGGIRFINQALAVFFPHRTTEAIKKARQKASYRQDVDSYRTQIRNFSSSSSQAITPATNPSTNTFLEYLRNLPPPANAQYNTRLLMDITNQAESCGKEETRMRLGQYLKDIFPNTPRTRNRNRRPEPEPTNRRQQRRRQYKEVQVQWQKHQKRCIKALLEGPNQSRMPPTNIMEPFWRKIMEIQRTNAPEDENRRQPLETVWMPITEEEIKTNMPNTSTSPGPDGVTARQLKAVPTGIILRILNLILWCGKPPQHLGESRTTLIPKKLDSSEPGDYRPITVSSVILRHLHSILARRLSNALELDPRQQAFMETDGCAVNVTIVDLLLRHHHKTYKSCYIAALDVAKAFDSVSHETILGTLRSYGSPPELTNYIEECYKISTTRLNLEGRQSRPITPKSGVKQGDPLSPTLFNMIIDRLIKSLPEEIRCNIGSAATNAIAFADDLILCASTPMGLQKLLDHTHVFLTSCGLALNPAKCISISIKGQAKQKITVIEQRSFYIAGQRMPALKREEEWVYLGVKFTPDGRCKIEPQVELVPKLQRITRAPLKPQQRLHILRSVLIPQLYHKLTLGSTNIGCLRKVDILIRAEVRKWLDLPKDIPIAYFHAPTSHGGLGITSLRWKAPMLRANRLHNLQLPYLGDVITANTYLGEEIDKATARLRVDGQTLRNSKDIDDYWSLRLHRSVDGAGLKEAGEHKQAHRWIREPTKLLSGRDFVHSIKTRINALPSKSRTTRGRDAQDRRCRAGCPVPETLNHIVQQCHRTHSSRIDRHNSIIKYIRRNAANQGLRTLEEPTVITEDGPRKPDLVIATSREAIVIDAQVVTDGRPLEEAHSRKLAKYNTPHIKAMIANRLQVDEVRVATATLNWRGVWAKSSIEQLLRYNILNVTDTALISTRVLIGTYRSFRQFNENTMQWNPG